MFSWRDKIFCMAHPEDSESMYRLNLFAMVGGYGDATII